ncbi:MATE efflux family protein DTX1 [Triticum urartu]|uniref:MATE efflux family protein DTX1 n=1 Tax=Triticum urartu TaxID=4572 RepID=M7Z7D4_TRIUA|nr:MATE efflux family protein DTX1 [Triticum urartu]
MDPPSPPHDHGRHEQEHHQDGCPAAREKRPWGWARAVAGEARAQRGIALPLIGMNLTWFAKQAVTTAFLGRLGDLQLAAGTLGFSFANATGFAVLTGLCGAMDPICGQAHGAGNAALLRRTLLMATAMLLAASLPIALLWLRVDTVLLRVFGQQPDIAVVARRYVLCLLPDLAVTSFLAPLKSYLSSQEETKTAAADWLRLIRLAVPCCLNTCLEWWCYEILILLTGRLPDARRAVAVIAITLNFDYLLFAGMLSLSVSASVRVSNSLGAGDAVGARTAGAVSILGEVLAGCSGGLMVLLVVIARMDWGVEAEKARLRAGAGGDDDRNAEPKEASQNAADV